MLMPSTSKQEGACRQEARAVVVDPASDWPLFAEKARELILEGQGGGRFGCWTSVARKSVLPVFSELTTSCSIPSSTGEKASATSSIPVLRPNQQRSRRRLPIARTAAR